MAAIVLALVLATGDQCRSEVQAKLDECRGWWARQKGAPAKLEAGAEKNCRVYRAEMKQRCGPAPRELAKR